MSEQPIHVDTGLSSSSGAGLGASGVEAIDAPMLDFSAPSYEDFSKAVSDGSTVPGGFAKLLQGDDSPTSGGGREDIVQFAKRFLGTPYVWGGTSPNGFDCSGFVQYVAKHFGLNLPRISNQQASSGKRENIGQLQAGDLVAWDENSRNSGADHIAFYIGNGYIIEAPHTGANVRIRKLGSKEGAWGVHLDYPK